MNGGRECNQFNCRLIKKKKRWCHTKPSPGFLVHTAAPYLIRTVNLRGKRRALAAILPGGTSPNMVNFTWVGKWAQWPRPVLGKDKKSTYCATCAIHNGIMRLLRKRSATPLARSRCCCSFAIVHKRHVNSAGGREEGSPLPPLERPFLFWFYLFIYFSSFAPCCRIV